METMEEQLAAIRGELKRIAERMESRLPEALTRKRAAAELSFSLSKLKSHIAEGKILTCADPSLIPRSEIFRLSQPVKGKKKRAPRPSGYRKKQRETVYSAQSEAEKARKTKR